MSFFLHPYYIICMIKHYLKNTINVDRRYDSDSPRHRIQEITEALIETSVNDYDTDWKHIKTALDFEFEKFTMDEIKRRLKLYFEDNKSDEERHYVEDCLHFYLKYLIPMKNEHFRHILEDEAHELLKYDMFKKENDDRTFENTWEWFEELICFAEENNDFEPIDKMYSQMDSETLKRLFRPDIYVKDVYSIDYKKLKEKGVKVISFDVDDTIEWAGAFIASQKTKDLINSLESKGFKVALVSNSSRHSIELLKKDIGNWHAIRGAEKPYSISFNELMRKYENDFKTELNPEEIVHVGNSIVKDIRGGNEANVITCMVRNKGPVPRICRVFVKEGEKIRERLEKEKIWRKHSLRTDGDQYYDLYGTQEW